MVEVDMVAVNLTKEVNPKTMVTVPAAVEVASGKQHFKWDELAYDASRRILISLFSLSDTSKIESGGILTWALLNWTLHLSSHGLDVHVHVPLFKWLQLSLQMITIE